MTAADVVATETDNSSGEALAMVVSETGKNGEYLLSLYTEKALLEGEAKEISLIILG